MKINKWFTSSNQSNDEYVIQKKNKFKIEALYLIIGLLLLNGIRGILMGDYSENVLMSLGIVFFYAIYFMLRYIFTGLEYRDVTTDRGYRKKRREVLMISLSAFGIFFIVTIGQKLLFRPDKPWMDVIGPSVLFLIILAAGNYFSLRRSYAKNKEIFGDTK
ncbi:DUF6773 family protein [Paenibacillus sp. chi10]|uniref:DUF6773 family protein n=1 Tax=Paenibacillus suaedae TaxID=3077233 RepID=A0AAJ2JPS3_9BACL|nr:DUF6773 family protein [Paenibacillus sp. chi10]MDT8974718.1 DUF6773 family protein [Paenibacillus sp. chi10]